MIPLWSVFALGAALTVTSVPLLQEKYKADGFALTLWLKVFASLFMFIPVLHVGLPLNTMFYVYIALSCFIYIISDIIYFRAVPIIGSGMMTRLLPSSVILTFLLWFLIEPSRLNNYVDHPWVGLGTMVLMILFVFFALQVKKCPVSWEGVRLIWPVIVAACLGPILTKMALLEATPEQASYAYMFVQSVMTVLFIGMYYAIRKPVSREILFSRNSIQTGFIIGIAVTLMLYLKTQALQLADNPGYVTMIFFTDALWILLVYRLIGRKEKGNIRAGLGIVACAAMLVLLKSIVQ